MEATTSLVWLTALAVGSLLPAIALLLQPALARASASMRHLVLLAALATSLVVPGAYLLAPPPAARPAPEAPAADGPPTPDVVVSAGAATGGRGDANARGRAGGRAARAGWSSTAAPTAAALWLAGFTLLALRALRAQRALARLLRRCGPAPEAWREALAEASRRFPGAPPRCALVSARGARIPFVAGVLRPVLVVPAAEDGFATVEARAAALVHELAHVARRDCLAQWLARAACALHFWSPAVWWAARRLHLEGERAADDRVLRAGYGAAGYADLLLAQAVRGGGAAALVAVSFGRRSQLERRVRHLLAPGRRRGAAGRPAAAIVVALFALGGASLARAGWNKPVRRLDADAATAKPAGGGRASTIDPRLQGIAEAALTEAEALWQPARAALVAIDVETGAVVALAGRAHRRPDAAVAADRAFPVASAVKPLVLAAALRQGRLPLDGRYRSDGPLRAGPYTARDAADHGELDTAAVLEVSSNVGYLQIARRLDWPAVGTFMGELGLRSRVQIDLLGAVAPDEAAPAEDVRAFGAALGALAWEASPLELAAAYVPLANGGAFVPPRAGAERGERRRVLSAEAARTLRGFLEQAVHGPRATGKRARVDGVRVGGKTGTWRDPDGDGGAWFVGLAPVEAPRFSIAALVERPRGRLPAGETAAPLFARFAREALGPAPAR